ncbi:MAG: class I SAM-dependent methyltransferase [Blastocatellia bacterium]|jgi:SAM-dependent methyltransferase
MPQWDDRYGAGEYVYGTEPNDFLAEMAERIPPGRVLCLAEGQGRNAVFLSGLGAGLRYEVTGVDSSAVGLEMAQRLAADRGVRIETQVADLAQFDPGVGVWDGIVSIFCHLPAQLRSEVMRKVVRALRPGGVLILEAYTPDQLRFETGGPRSTDLLASLADLKSDLAGLRFDHAVEIERDVVEGQLHKGRAAVVQIVAVRPEP